jgi:NAD(P)-dependent dehydrogenase (short-subunit alcohol dehydrogenase family)
MTAGLVSKTALITGAGRDTGAAIAHRPAKAGADVILLASTAELLNETASPSGPVRRVLRFAWLPIWPMRDSTPWLSPTC